MLVPYVPALKSHISVYDSFDEVLRKRNPEVLLFGHFFIGRSIETNMVQEKIMKSNICKFHET